MRRLLFLAVACLLWISGFAHGDDAPPSTEERVERIRKLPAEEKLRLKAALERFNALPAAERERLRRKAREVGVERLGELAGRDFARLRRRHQGLRREIDEIMKLLGGVERFDAAKFTVEEREFVRGQALRAFQAHCRVAMLEQAELGLDFGVVSGAEKRARLRKSMDIAVAKLLEEKPPAEQSRFRSLPAVEQRRERGELLAEWRMRQTSGFARRFERHQLRPLLEMSPERRRAEVAKKVRWLQLAGFVQSDGVDRDTMRMLAHLGADERAKIALLYEQSRDLAREDRRAKVVDKIRELYGSGAVEADRPRRPMPRLGELFRERAFRERRVDPSAPDRHPDSSK